MRLAALALEIDSLLVVGLFAAAVLVVLFLRRGERDETPTEGLAPPSAAVREALLAGNKIEAIKRYRAEEPRAGLAQAKEIVERIE